MKTLACLFALAFSAAVFGQSNTLTDQEKADGWALLFDGKSLDGWDTVGELAAWTVEQDKDGPVITMAKPGRGEWLHTTKMYRDYELLVDFDVGKGKNSGVGLRGSSFGDPAFTGMEIQVFGNQGEKPTITCCGSVYDACTPVVHTADGLLPLKDGGQWNTYRIKIVGDTLNIWMNGDHIQTDQKLDGRGYTHKPEAKNPLNSRCKTGFIALQDHGDKVRFRNIKIKDLSADKDPGGFVPLFNGKDTVGWNTNVKDHKAEGKWRVEDGVLVGNRVGLVTDAAWSAAELRAFVWVGGTGSAAIGMQTDTGSLQLVPVTETGRWTDVRVRVDDNDIQVWLDGQQVKPSPATPKWGPRHFYIWAGGADVKFKDVQVRDLGKKER
jgi:hypothetical protein